MARYLSRYDLYDDNEPIDQEALTLMFDAFLQSYPTDNFVHNLLYPGEPEHVNQNASDDDGEDEEGQLNNNFLGFPFRQQLQGIANAVASMERHVPPEPIIDEQRQQMYNNG
jgi:hypothetical protein